jgi:dTDP-glucose 4,6-dehydratase
VGEVVCAGCAPRLGKRVMAKIAWNRVLVTGGAGFIGSAVVRRLLADGYAVRVIDRLSIGGDARNLQGLDVELHIGDILVAPDLSEAMEGVDFVVHLAAESHVTRSLCSPLDFFEVNLRGSCAVFQAATSAGVPVLFMSTDEVFGSAPVGVAFRASDPLRPGNPYAASKVAAEAALWAWRQSFGLIAGIVRCTNNYGPRQHVEKAIPAWIRMGLGGGLVRIHGQGRPMRDWIHVDDCARGISAIVAGFYDGGVWHLAGRNERTNREVALRVVDLTGASGIFEGPDRQGQDWAYRLDDSATRTQLGWAPVVDWDAGLAATVEWYREGRRG